MNTKDPAVEKTELVIKALDYAHIHSLDIGNKDNVKKIVEVLDPEHSSNEDVEELVELLKNSDTFMEITAREKESEKTDSPN